MLLLLLSACSAGKAANDKENETVNEEPAVVPAFDADSAYSYVKALTDFGARVPNTDAHRRSGDWLEGKLKEFGWEVMSQKASLRAFDGTTLQARNIFAQINPEKPDRLLLLAHWDSRPWADQDSDPAKHSLPVVGANDGASGVGVLLEIARQLKMNNSEAAIDILFVDAEDWGSYDDEDSWALGTRYFAQNPVKENYKPSNAILLDMVGAPDARFGVEYFSNQSNPGLIQQVLAIAVQLGHDNYFHNGFGGAITDDHVELIKAGIPAIDIIDYRHTPQYQGFDPNWHTSHDDISNISSQTLRAVGETVLGVIMQ